jgi:drug/metabolite transporter (DMT)-like permease
MNAGIKTSMGASEWAMLLALSVLWGGSFFFVEVLVAELPPITVVFLRVSLAAVTLWAIIFASGIRPPASLGVWSAFLAMGLLNNVVPFCLIAWGQTQISSGLASILNATTPLFTVIVAGTVLADERATPLKLAGVFTGFTGVVVMIGPEALRGLGLEGLAQFAVLGAALSYACAGVFGRRFRRFGVHPVATAAGQVTASSLILGPLALFIDGPYHPALADTSTIAAIVGLAVLSTAFAYVLYFRLLASAGATNLLLVTFLIPISAILLGWLVLGESMETTHLLGMGMIGIGLSAVDGRLWGGSGKPLRDVSRTRTGSE